LAFPKAQEEARRLQQLMSEHLGHDAVQVRPYGQHLVMDIVCDDDAHPVARLTRLEQGRYGLGFRLHTGRWDPMPLEGSLEEVATGTAQMLASHLDPSIY